MLFCKLLSISLWHATKWWKSCWLVGAGFSPIKILSWALDSNLLWSEHTHKYSPAFLPGTAHQRSCLSPKRSKRSKLYPIKGWLKHGLHAGEGQESKLNYCQAGGYFIRFSHRTDKVQIQVLRWNLLFTGSLDSIPCQRPRQPRIPLRQLDRAAGNAGGCFTGAKSCLHGSQGDWLPQTSTKIRIWHE